MSGAGVDVIRARVALRHRAMADVLDLALRFIVVHARPYATTAVVTTAPGVLVVWLAARTSGWIAGWLVATAWAMFAQVPYTLLASRLVFEDRVRTRDVVLAAMKDIPRVLALRVVVSTSALLASLLFVVPAVWVGAIFAFSTEVLLLERASVTQTLGRAQRIAQSDVGEALLFVLVSVVVPCASLLLADWAGRMVIGELLQFRPPASLFDEGGSLLATSGLLAAAPYVATARFFTYLNVRTRAEGWDIQTRFAAIAARAKDRVEEAA